MVQGFLDGVFKPMVRKLQFDGTRQFRDRMVGVLGIPLLAGLFRFVVDSMIQYGTVFSSCNGLVHARNAGETESWCN